MVNRLVRKLKNIAVENEEDMLHQKTKHLLGDMIDKYLNACKNGDEKIANKHHEYIKYLYTVERILVFKPEQISMSDISSTKEYPTYILSSMLLNSIFECLIEGNENQERICYCSGVIDKPTNTYIPLQILLEPKLEEQSPVFAKSNPGSTKNILLDLDRFDHTMLLHCHSHPGIGPKSTYPSTIDKKCHRGLETCYPVLGLIFVQNGYFRVFSVTQKFHVKIYGTGVKEVGKRIFCLQNSN